MIQIERYPSFLSASSLNLAEKSPNKFYLKRLSNTIFPKDEQTLAASIGSAFDYLVKDKIIKSKLPTKISMLADMFKSVENNHEEAWQVGGKIYTEYEKFVLDIYEFEDVEVVTGFTVDLKPVFGLDYKIPLYIKIDGIKRVTYFNEPIIHDWKVSGYTSEAGISPKPGYFRVWENGRLKPCHDNYSKEISIEDIDLTWGTQLCTYGLWKHGYGKKFPVSIDMICFNNKNDMRVAQYQAWVPVKFQQNVIYKYAMLWKSLLDGSFVDRLISKTDLNMIFIKAMSEDWW